MRATELLRYSTALERTVEMTRIECGVWLGESKEVYPRYPQIRDEFAAHLNHLISFVAECNLGQLVPDHWEVTYVNRIDRGVWETPADWGFFRPLNGVPTIPDLIEAESFSGEWHFVIPKQRGRLHVQWQHAKDSESDAVSHVQLTLTARGPIDKDQGSNDNSAVISGLDLGRATVVRSFRHLMTVDANSEWKLKNASSS